MPSILTALLLVPLVALLAAIATTQQAGDQPILRILLGDDMGYGDPGCCNANPEIATSP